MAASVQVLCPNGRRQTVKINPNTKLLQILEEVCQRQGYIPPEDYKLIQGKKVLDLSLSVRFSSLTNNAKLELTKSDSARVEQDVTIALQLDSGQRLQGNFKPSASLWDILLHLEGKNSKYDGVFTKVDTSHNPAVHPVCIYMREEVIGKAALLATTLKKLGLTSGKAIIRLLHRPVDESVLGEIIEQIEKEKQKQARLEEIAIKKSEMRQLDELERIRKSSAEYPLEKVEENMLNQGQMEMDEVQITSPSVESGQGAESGYPELMEEITEDAVSSSTSSEPSSTKPRIPGTTRRKAPLLESQSESNQSASTVEEFRNLNIPGVEIFTPNDFNDLTSQEQVVAQHLAQQFLPALMASPEVTQPQTPFSYFRFPESTQGMDLTGSATDDVQEEVTQACKRETIVYSADEPLSMGTDSEEIPDEFFEVTQADVRTIYRDLQNSLRQLEDQPLMTKAMRQAQAEALFDQYEQVIIRVQFPDRLVLQGLFRPRELVSTLYAFVKEHLVGRTGKFYLYTTPPKEVLIDKHSSLAANHLAPAALVYFGSEDQRDHFLSEEIRSKVSRRLEAETQVTRVLKPPVHSMTSTAAIEEAGSSRASTSQEISADVARRAALSRIVHSSPASSSSSGSQVPKWLKLGKK